MTNLVTKWLFSGSWLFLDCFLMENFGEILPSSFRFLYHKKFYNIGTGLLGSWFVKTFISFTNTYFFFSFRGRSSNDVSIDAAAIASRWKFLPELQNRGLLLFFYCSKYKPNLMQACLISPLLNRWSTTSTCTQSMKTYKWSLLLKGSRKTVRRWTWLRYSKSSGLATGIFATHPTFSFLTATELTKLVLLDRDSYYCFTMYLKKTQELLQEDCLFVT